MATLNLGRIKPVFRGAYNNGTAYVVDDIVTSGGSSYICIQASTGNAVSSATYWTQMSSAGTNGTDVGTTITTQGDILYRDGSGLQRLAKGTANQELRMNSGATAPEWHTPSGGGILQLKHSHITGTQSIGSGSGTAGGIDITNSEVSLTPSSSSNKIMIITSMQLSGDNDLSMKIQRKIGSGSYGDILLNSQRGSETLAHVSNTIRSDYEMSPHNVQLLDAPNTTSQVYYKAVAKNGPEGGGGGYVNRPATSSTGTNQETLVSTITIMEISSAIL
jgi:hypothetical protein